MTTEEDLRARREAALIEARRQEREATRRLVSRHAHRHGLSTVTEDELLSILGLLDDPTDDTPVVLPTVFNQPTGWGR